MRDSACLTVGCVAAFPATKTEVLRLRMKIISHDALATRTPEQHMFNAMILEKSRNSSKASTCVFKVPTKSKDAKFHAAPFAKMSPVEHPIECIMCLFLCFLALSSGCNAFFD